MQAKPRFKPIRTEDVPQRIRHVDGLFVGQNPISKADEVLDALRGYITNNTGELMYAVNRSGRYWVARLQSPKVKA